MNKKEENLNLIYQDKELQSTLIKKFQPGFLKFADEGKFEINRTVKLNIPTDNIVFSPDGTLDSETSEVKNSYDESFISKGSIKSNVNISKSIKNIISINFENNLTYEKSKNKNNVSKSVRYKHYVYKSFITMSIPQNDFKLDENIKQEFRAILKKETDKEKMDELSRLFNKYGIGIPFEFVLGGKFYMYFDAKNDEEKDEIVKNFNNIASLSVGKNKIDLNAGFNDKDGMKRTMSNTNIKLSVIGGDSEKKDNYNEWLKSLNINNSEIIQYKTLRAIHYFCDDDVKKEIDNLLERESKRKLEEAEELKKINEEEQKKLKELDDKEDDNTEDVMIIVLGDNSSGKTSFIQRYIKGPSKQIKTKKTVAFKCEKKWVTFSINNVIHKINIQLQDNPINSERIKELDISYVSQGDSIILVVDLDVEKKDTINNLDIWHDLLCTYNKKMLQSFYYLQKLICWMKNR